MSILIFPEASDIKTSVIEMVVWLAAIYIPLQKFMGEIEKATDTSPGLVHNVTSILYFDHDYSEI